MQLIVVTVKSHYILQYSILNCITSCYTTLYIYHGILPYFIIWDCIVVLCSVYSEVYIIPLDWPHTKHIAAQETAFWPFACWSSRSEIGWRRRGELGGCKVWRYFFGLKIHFLGVTFYIYTSV